MERERLAAAAVAIAAQVYLSPIPEVSTVKVILTYFISNITLFCYLLLSVSAISDLILKFAILNLIFLSTATALTLIRRLYFHPLSHIPGPRLAALSNIWISNQFRLGRTSRTCRDLHEEYSSDVIRVGPNEISIRNVDAVEVVFKGKYPRGTLYDIGKMKGEFDVNSTRDYNVHGPGRKLLEKAFMNKEIREYSPRLEYHLSKTMKLFHDTKGKEINFTDVMANLVFDIMADLSFGNDAGLQDGTGDRTYPNFLHKFMSLVAMFGSLRNLCQLLIYLPENEDVRVFRTRGEAMLAERQALGTSRKDIFSHLLIADTTTGRAFTQKQLDSTANLIIVAGSDTTSTTLTQLFRLLAVDAHTQKGRKEESVYKKLQKEIDSLYEGEGNLSIENVRNAKYLNAVINEALRLCNPIPSGAQAATPPQGIEFAGLHIPGNINVWVPHLGLMTDERYFPSGTDFIPERWTGEQPELLNEFSSKAFIPFGYGMHNCVGKQLALNEMRIVVARIVRDFDVLLGESYNEEQFDSEWKDHIAVKLGALWLKFLPRETPKPA